MTNRVAVDQIFHALADANRRHILETLGNQGPKSASALAANAQISRQAIAKHLAIMEAAGLLNRARFGREVLFAVDPRQISATGRWMQRIAGRWEHQINEAATA